MRAGLLALALACVASALESADTYVQRWNWTEALRDDRAAVVALTRGQDLAADSELSKAAQTLHPLVSFFAIDCDASENGPLCAHRPQPGVGGLTTVLLFPRGLKTLPLEFDSSLSALTAESLVAWATESLPAQIARPIGVPGLSQWRLEAHAHPRVALLNRSKCIPLLWKVLANKYHDSIQFASVRDARGKVSMQMGFDGTRDEKTNRVVALRRDSEDIVPYTGAMEYKPLVEFLDRLVLGIIEQEGDVTQFRMQAERKNIR